MMQASGDSERQAAVESPLKILMVTSHPDAPVVAWMAAKGLWERGHKVELLVPAEGRLSAAANDIQMPVHIINIRSSLVTGSYLGKRILDIKAIWKLRKLLKRKKYDVMHLNLMRARILGRLAAAGLRGVAVVSTVHGPDLETWPMIAMERASNWVDTLMTTVSDDVSDYVAERRIPRRKLVTVYNGLDIARFDAAQSTGQITREQIGLPRQGLVVAMFAYMYPGVKGHETFLEAARIVSQQIGYNFLLVGGSFFGEDDWYKRKLEQTVQESGIADRVTFLGNRNDVPQLLRLVDVVVLPTYVREGFGMVLLEAMAARRPVIGSAIGGIPELIRDDVNGYLVEPRNAQSLAQAILRLGSDPGLREVLGQQGRRRAEQEFSSALMVSRYEAAFRKAATQS